MPALIVGTCVVESETVSGTNAATTLSAPDTGRKSVCRVSTDTLCYVSFNSAPNAGTDTIRFLIQAGATEYFIVNPGDKGACIAA